MTCYDFRKWRVLPQLQVEGGGYIRIVKMYVGFIVDLGMFPQ